MGPVANDYHFCYGDNIVHNFPVVLSQSFRQQDPPLYVHTKFEVPLEDVAVLNPRAIRPRNVGTVFVQDTTVYFTLSNGVV